MKNAGFLLSVLFHITNLKKSFLACISDDSRSYLYSSGVVFFFRFVCGIPGMESIADCKRN